MLPPLIQPRLDSPFLELCDILMMAMTQMYTVMMVDANPVGTDESSTEQTRHWLVNGASLGDSAPYAVNYTGSTPVYVASVVIRRSPPFLYRSNPFAGLTDLSGQTMLGQVRLAAAVLTGKCRTLHSQRHPANRAWHDWHSVHTLTSGPATSFSSTPSPRPLPLPPIFRPRALPLAPSHFPTTSPALAWGLSSRRIISRSKSE